MSTAPAPPRQSNLEGALWMLASAAAFTVMTTLIKYLGDGYSAPLQAFYRQLAGFVVLLPWLVRDWRGSFATSRPGIMVFRSVAGTAGLTLSFYAFQHLPLGDANALSFTRTLWIVPLAAVMLREPIGPLRIGAALVGFAGVLLMLRPGAPAGAGSDAPAWIAQAAMLGSSLLFALTITGMKVATRDTRPFVLLAWSATLGLVLALPPALLSWRWPTWPDLGLLAAMGVIGTVTQACYIKGMQRGDAAAMAPIDYVRLVFALAAGWLLFRETPTWLTLVGAGVVIASTLFITWREARVAPRVHRDRVKDPAAVD